MMLLGNGIEELLKKQRYEEIKAKYYVTSNERYDWYKGQIENWRAMERSNSLDFLFDYDKLYKTLKRIPTIEEYMDMTWTKTCNVWLRMIAHGNAPKVDCDSPEDDKAFVRRIIGWRLARTYVSHMVEEYVSNYYNMNLGRCYTNIYFDTSLGVDLVVRSNSSIKYIHITKSSATDYLDRKSAKTHFQIEGRWFEYWRSFYQDDVLTYDLDKGKANMIGDWSMPTKMYMTRIFNSENGETVGANNKLEDFRDFLIEENLAHDVVVLIDNILK